MNCSKCKTFSKKGTWYFDKYRMFHFCKTCSEILETFPSPEKMIDEFIKPDSEKNKVNRGIFEARARRVAGETWSEFGTDAGVSFCTSKGIKKMETGKIYDENLNEICPMCRNGMVLDTLTGHLVCTNCTSKIV